MSYSQTRTQAKAGFESGVKDYKLTYYTPDYTPKDTDILAAFRVTPQTSKTIFWPSKKLAPQ